VPVKSRRRCCACFGLNKDDSVKTGHIAHLDQDSANNSEANLAFLCLPHHDQYDRATGQSKNLTKKEIGKYRLELYQHFSPWNRASCAEFLLKHLAGSQRTADIARTLSQVAHEATAFPDSQLNLALLEN
jgi:hypothetical protein